MKRRNFILGGGLFATLSLGATATNASLAESVAALADFRVITETDLEADIELDPSTQFAESTHTWDEMNFTSGGQEIDRIEADYDFDEDGGFDTVDEDATDVEFFSSRGDRLRSQDFTLINVDGATATFDIDDGEDEIINNDEGTNVLIDIVDFENPEQGSYESTLTFVRDDGETATVKAEFSTSSGDGFFTVTITDAPSQIGVGETIEVEAEIENEGFGEDTQEITLSVEGEEQDSTSETLEAGETETVNLESDEIESGGEVEVVVASEDADDNDAAEDSTTVDVTGGWSIELDPPDEGAESEHTWSTSGFEFDGEVEEIFFEYSDDRRGFRLDGLEEQNVTVEMEVDGELTTIDVENLTTDPDNTAEVELDPDADTTVDGEMTVVLNGVENNNQAGEYETDIELRGDDRFDETVIAEVE